MKFIIELFALFLSAPVIAGGNNNMVRFPAGYREAFTLYHTMNRQNNEQIVDLYANEAAMKSAKDGTLANRSIIVMEIYAPELDAAGKPVTEPGGLLLKAGLSAVAVMEKRTDWGETYPADERAGDWGFALYTPDGLPKENDLVCQACHQPLSGQDFLFTLPRLAGQ